MVGFGGGHLGVGWVSRWRSSLSHGGDRVMGHSGDWVFGFQLVFCCDGLLWRRWVGLGLCFNGVLLWWCCGSVGFLMVVLWLFATVIQNNSKRTRQHRSLWAPQSSNINLSATEFCISVFENTSFVFLVSITLTQNF